MPNIVLTRIDNRLVHGQVATQWCGAIGANLILVANDEVAGNKLRQGLMDMAAPSYAAMRYWSIEKTISTIHKASDKQLIFIVCETPQDVLRLVEQERCTALYGVPTMFVAELHHEDFDKFNLSSLRTGIMAGSVCPIETMKEVMDKMYMKDLISVYGLTETSPGMTCSKINHPIEKRTTTVGTEYPNVEVKIFNQETGKECGINEPGEICCRGYNVMIGYYKNQEATDQAIDKDGWLHSGDICMRTPDGYYKVTGRLKDMIIRGGENLYPREIEEFYLTNPKVRDVQVVGVPDEQYGEECCAWIILHKGETADEKEMKEYGYASIAKHKVPKYFLFVNEFPMNAAGKILKYKMREESLDRYNNQK